MTNERSILKCRHCSKEFKYASERRRHEQSHFPQFQCKVCSKNFSFISALRRHEKQHERTGSVQCKECSREFRDSTLLKRHTKYAHGGVHTCSQCSGTFSSEPALATHMKTHKSVAERRYQCSFSGCTKKFNFAHHLKHHELTHTNTKQHYCKICNKGFIQSHHLKTHLKTHSADCSLWCTFPDCNKKFTTEYAKKRHLAKHHKTDSGISSDSNSACDLSCLSREESDAIKCSSCGLIMNKTLYEKHTISCNKNTIEEFSTEALPLTNSNNYILGDNYNDTEKIEEDDDGEVHNCKLVLGACIMTEKGEKCVCAQISSTVDEDYDFTPIDNNEPINMSKVNNKFNNLCEGCECSDRCNIKNVKSGQDMMPEIDYKTDGTVKIKDTFDMDIGPTEIVKIESKVPTNDVKFVPFNSCKAILGNCIVSGNGTMGDGCLCARMILDEQVTDQEIEDITPHPKEELFYD